MKFYIILMLFSILACSEENRIVPVPNIGSEYQGGIVFYIFQPGDQNYIKDETHGLISSRDDLKSTFEWGCATITLSSFGWQLGDGYTNTEEIIKYCEGNNAAQACKSTSLGGYKDWYLPNAKEVMEMYNNKQLIGNFSTGYYWTSNKTDYSHANAFRFSDRASENYPFYNLLNVRPIRKF